MPLPVDDAPGTVSVVVITRNRRHDLVANLPRLLALPERPPIIVVDNDSSDGTLDAVRRDFAEVRVERLDRNAGAAGRNVGVALAPTPYVAFADDDSWWQPGALAHAARLLDDHSRLALIAGQVLVGDEGVPDATCRAMERSPLPRRDDLPGPSVLGFIACGAIVRRQPFLAVGGFDERFGVGGEEQPLALDLAAAGWGLCYVDEVVAVHHPSPARDRRARLQRVVRNDLWLAWSRRRAPSAVQATVSAVAAACRDGVARAGLVEAVGGAVGVLRARRPIPARLEQEMRLLERRRCQPVAAS